MDQRDEEIISYIITNKNEILKDIHSVHNNQYLKLPSNLPEIYLDQYKIHSLNTIKNHLDHFHLSPEENAGLEELIVRALGKTLLTPPT